MAGGHYSGGVGGHRQETKRVSFFYLLSSPFPIPFSFFEREMKTDIIQYWLEMVYGNEYYFSSFCFPWFVFVAGRSGMGCADIKSG